MNDKEIRKTNESIKVCEFINSAHFLAVLYVLILRAAVVYRQIVVNKIYILSFLQLGENNSTDENRTIH